MPNFDDNPVINKICDIYLTLFFNKHLQFYKDNGLLSGDKKYESLESYLATEKQVFKNQLKRIIL